MTATRDPDRLLRAWLDLMPDEAPDRVIESVLQSTQGVPQLRRLPWDGIRRDPRMNRLILIAATAVLAIALVGGAVLLSTGGPGPVSSPSPTPVPASAAATAADLVAPMPEQVWGDWIAQTEAVPGLIATAQQVQLSLNWDGGLTAWLQLNGEDGRFVAESSSLDATAGQLRFRTDVGATGCTFGTTGSYRWARSSDGLFLNLELLEDECAPRGAALARTWVRSLGAVQDGGTGVAYGLTPMVQVSLPRGQRLAASGGTQWTEIKTFGDTQPFQAFVVVGNPGGFGAPCSTTDTKKLNITHTTDAFIEYVQGLPGLSVTTTPTEVDGRPAIRFDYSVDDAVDCPAGDVQAFHPQDPADEFAWGSVPGELQRMYIVQVDGSNTFLLWYQGNSETERQVIDSVRFIDELPTPPA